MTNNSSQTQISKPPPLSMEMKREKEKILWEEARGIREITLKLLQWSVTALASLRDCALLPQKRRPRKDGRCEPAFSRRLPALGEAFEGHAVPVRRGAHLLIHGISLWEPLQEDQEAVGRFECLQDRPRESPAHGAG